MRRVFLALLVVLAVLAACTALPAQAAGPAQAETSQPGWSIQHSGSTATLRDVACLSTTHCFATGDAGTLLVTTDSGRVWHRQRLPATVPAAAPLFQLTCAGPATCYAIARPDIVLVTHDSGTVWTAHILPVRVPALTVPQAGCPDGIVVQLGGYQPPNPPAGWVLCGLGLLDVSCVNAMNCYAVASNSPAYDVTGEASASAPPRVHLADQKRRSDLDAAANPLRCALQRRLRKHVLIRLSAVLGFLCVRRTMLGRRREHGRQP